MHSGRPPQKRSMASVTRFHKDEDQKNRCILPGPLNAREALRRVGPDLARDAHSSLNSDACPSLNEMFP